MSRFVMVSFAFLGWTFFELSGGSDFTPPERPNQIVAAKPTLSTELHVTAASLVSRQLIQPANRTGLQLRSNKITTPQPDRPNADPNLRSEVALTQITTLGDGLKFGLSANDQQSDEPSLQLASLSGGLASLTTGDSTPIVDTPLPEATTATIDMRHVTASRVNMRDGPGTIYPVVKQLNRNASVEVLEDSGTGWLHLRVADSEQVGWIAASLISKKRP